MPSPINRVHRAEIVDRFTNWHSFKRSFADIVDKDSHGKRFGFTDDILAMRCIDMDAVEIARSKQLGKTMDCCIGIAKWESPTRTYSAHKLLLVELKLNCGDNHNVKAKEYRGKISHTVELLKPSKLHPKRIFLFRNPAYSKAKSDVARWCKGGNAGVLRDVLILTPEEFNEFIGFEHQFEHIPLTKAQDIVKSVKDTSHSADELLNVIEAWMSIAYGFRSKYNVFEAEYIELTLREEVLRVLPEFNNEVDRLLLEMTLPNERDVIEQNDN